MLVRPYTDADLSALRAMHARQNFGYPLPDLNDPLFLVRLVVEDDAALPATGAGGPNVPAEAAQTPPDPSRARDLPLHSPHRRIRMAALLRLTAEAYLLADPRDGTPRQRWQWLAALHEATRVAAAGSGLADVQAFLPPQVARAFGRRLETLGWRRDPWPAYTRWLP